MYKHFLKKLIISITLVLLLISSINFIVDPGEIYLKKILADIKSATFSDKLFNSQNGIIQTGWNERLVKTTLAKSANEFDCVVLGSSHAMQISSVRNTGNIKEQCKKVLNLAVSGGSIEDVSIFSYLILNNLQFPKQVFIGVDPWTLKFGMDSRYGAYQEYFEEMNLLLNTTQNQNKSYLSKIVKNLVNGEYLYYSLSSLISDEKNTDTKNNIFDKNIIMPKYSFSYKEGYEEAVTLPDGSHMYGSEWIATQKKKNPTIGIGGGYYKISGKVFDKSAIVYLQKIIKLYQHNNVKVNFILTPYHPNVFKQGVTKSVEHILITEDVVNKLTQKYSLSLYGSFLPNKLGCKEHEFFDSMHATSTCLNKIDFSK